MATTETHHVRITAMHRLGVAWEQRRRFGLSCYCGMRNATLALRIWETVHSQRFDYFCPSVWPERSQGRESLSLRPTWYMHLHPPDLTFLSVPSSCSRDPSSSTSVQQPHSVGSSRTACSKLSVVETASIPFFLIRDTACFAYLLIAPSFYRNKVI